MNWMRKKHGSYTCYWTMRLPPTSFIEMDEDARKEFTNLPSETIAKRFVDYMDSDDAVDIIRKWTRTNKEVLSHIEDIEQAGDICRFVGKI